VINSEYLSEPVLIASRETCLAGVLDLPRGPRGIVLLLRTSCARRLSPQADYLARAMRRAGLAILWLDPLGLNPARADRRRIDRVLFDTRLCRAADWLASQPETMNLALGLMGTGRDAAAALRLAALRPRRVAAVVSRGGRPDLAGPDALAQVRAPTLLLVGEEDQAALKRNRLALGKLNCEKELAVIRSSSARLEEPGASQEVARLAVRWFGGYFGGEARRGSPQASRTAH